MALKIIGFIFVLSLAFGIVASIQVKDVPFDVNEVINRVSPHHTQPPNPQSLTPDLTGEFLIDTSIIYVPAPYDQFYPSVAFDGNNYLVVWEDLGTDDIYGARVSQIGVVLDSGGIAISTATSSQGSPSVGFDGTNYFVVWTDCRGGNSDIYGTRVSPNGEVLDPAGIAVSTAGYDQYSPFLAFSDTNYLVVWEDFRSSSHDIYGARVNLSGIVLDPNGIPISTAIGHQESPSVAFDGTNYLVVWEAFSDIYGARVNQTGIVLDSSGIAISNATSLQRSPSVAFDGTNYLVVWDDCRNSNYSDIYGARLNQSGVVLDSTGIPISTAINHQELPSVAFDGTNYLLVWSDFRNGSSNIYGARVNPSGVILDPDGVLIAAYSQYSSVAFDGTNYFVVWTDYRNLYDDIYGARVLQTVRVLDSTGIIISTAADDQWSPSVAFDGTNYLVVWVEYHNTPDISDICGTRVNPSGIVLDSARIAISTAEYDQCFPSLAFDGTNYLVVWQDHRNNDTSHIYGTRASQSGVVLDPTGIAISTGDAQSSPSVAFDGTNYFVVWEDLRTEDIYGARVNQSGVVLDTNGFAISTAALDQYSPSVAFDGINYLVVWQDRRSGSFDIYGARVSPAGIVLDTNGIPISILTNDQDSPSLVFDGTNYLVVWQNRLSGNKFDIYGARVNPLGSVIDSFPISTQEGNQYIPSLAHGSENQVLITYSGWTERVQGKTFNNYRIWGKFYPFVPGISEENSKVKTQSAKLLEVYPNPAKSVIYVRVPVSVKEQTDLKIFDVSGKLIKEIAAPASPTRNDEVKVSLKGISPGIYFLRLGKETKKFLVVK